MMQPVEISFFPKDYKLEKGAKVGLMHKSGQPMQAVIADITGEKVVLDFNHFLAGKDLVFKVKIVSIK
jgi:peptidylprolyl isomerase